MGIEEHFGVRDLRLWVQGLAFLGVGFRAQGCYNHALMPMVKVYMWVI